MRSALPRRDLLKTGLALGLLSPASLLPGAEETAPVKEQLLSPSPERWISFRNGPSNPGVALCELPAQPKLLWDLESPDGITATPVIDGDRLYVGTLSGDMLCLDLATGKQLWKYVTQENVPANQLAPGFDSPLTLGTNLVYAGDDQGTMHAVDRTTGKLAWRVDTNASIVGGAVLIDGLEANSGPQLLFGSHAEKLFSVDCVTGEVKWMCNTNGPVNATPIVSGRATFLTGCDQPLMVAVNVDLGEKIEEIPIDGLLIASAAEKDGVLYFGTDDGIVFALDWQAKKQEWQYSVPEREYRIESSPAVTDELVLIGSQDKFLHAIDRRTGKARWEFRTRAQINSSPVVVGDRVFFGSGDKNVYAVSLAEGKEVWKFNAGQAIAASPAVANGYLVFGTEGSNGKILCFG